MKTSAMLLLTIVMQVNFSCTNTTGSPNHTEIKRQVDEVLKSYVSQVNAGGLEKAAGFFSDDSRFYWVEDGMVQYPDKAALIKSIAGFAQIVRSVYMTVSNLRVDVIDHTHALLFVQYKEDLILTSNDTIKLDGAMTILVEQKDQAWKFLSGHSSVKKPRTNH